MGYNLPPGVTENMIPGNRAKDLAWDRAWEKADMDLQDELGREPTKEEIQARAEEIMEEW